LHVRPPAPNVLERQPAFKRFVTDKQQGFTPDSTQAKSLKAEKQMILESTTFWLIVFYAFVALAIGFVLLVYRLLNRASFRRQDGEAIGVGYEEDSVGHVLGREPYAELTNDNAPDHAPHISKNQ
jgi:hypothetical protein